MKHLLLSLFILNICPQLGYGFFFAEKVVGSAVPQNVNIIGDSGQIERLAKMTQQIKEAKRIVDESRKIVSQTNRLIEIAGDPKSVINSMKDLNSATRQLDQIFKTPTTHELRNLVNGSESLQRSGFYLKDTVGDSYIAGKKQKKRQADLYRTFSLFENSYDSFEGLVDLDRKVQNREAKRQEKLINDLTQATTQAEVDKITAAIAASKGAQEASSFQVMKQKMAIDMQKMALENEREKIRTAHREEHEEALKQARERLKKREAIYEKQFNQCEGSKTWRPDSYQFL